MASLPTGEFISQQKSEGWPLHEYTYYSKQWDENWTISEFTSGVLMWTANWDITDYESGLLQSVESWDLNTIGPIEQQTVESFGIVPLRLANANANISISKARVGEPIEISGKSEYTTGEPLEAKVVVEEPSGNVRTIPANPDSTGNFTVSFDPDEIGTHKAHVENDVPGFRGNTVWDITEYVPDNRVTTAGWDIDSIGSVSERHEEGWNS